MGWSQPDKQNGDDGDAPEPVEGQNVGDCRALPRSLEGSRVDLLFQRHAMILLYAASSL